MPDFSKKSEASTEIPTASLADMVFVLLLFFMVTTTVKDQKIQVKVRFPQAQNIEKIAQKRLLSYIYVGPIIGGTQGQNKGVKGTNVAIQIDNAFVTMDEISSIMREKFTAEPRLIVSIRMDKNTRTGILTDIQQQLQEAGALRINYSAQPEGKE